MKIDLPNKIAICLVGGDKSISQSQMVSLRSLRNNFEIEWIDRSYQFSSNYVSFSQIINEATIISDSEFMIFINPKTIVSPEDALKIITNLCNGFAFCSVVNFGFWGVTKELFRKIGLMDERFIGGEWEDNDFFTRLKEANLATWPEYQFKTKYSWDRYSIVPQLRGVSRQIYEQKWPVIDGVRYRSDLYIEEKKLPFKIQNQKREDISNSWDSWEKSKIFKSKSHPFAMVNKLSISNQIAKSSKVKTDIIIRLEKNNGDGFFKIHFYCGVPTNLYIVIVPARPIGKEGSSLFPKYDTVIQSNHFQGINPIRFNNEKLVDIRIFNDGKLILNNAGHYIEEDIEYKLRININKFEL